MSQNPPLISWARGQVIADDGGWRGARQLRCAIPAADGGTRVVPALAFDAVTGPLAPGADVLLNAGALDKGLGTGGHALVVAVLPDGGPSRDPEAPGHLVKARYTPLQAMVEGVDEQGAAHHELLAGADSIDGMPVVTADLHSAVPAIIAGARAVWNGPGGGNALRVAYVMTDGGALPAAYSRTVAVLRESGWLAACITAGQAFGGDLEAVSVHSALLAARLVTGADIAIVAQGPGNLGTGTRWGFSGVSCGEAINAAAVLGGRPIGALRVSAADPRDRHRGVSHHSLTAYGEVALAGCEIALPDLPARYGQLQEQIAEQAAPLGRRHRLTWVAAGPLRGELEACPAELRSMGRGLADDEPCFFASAAAGALAASRRGA